MLKLEEKEIKRFKGLLEHADRIVITCHVAPDGDAIGSTMGLWHVLRNMGKNPEVITPDVPTKTLMFLPSAREIVPATKFPDRVRLALERSDLIVCLDFNALSRIDKMQPLIEEAQAPKVLIDHHLYPEVFAALTISRPKASSTCYLLYEVLKAAGLDKFIDCNSATCLYTGMMTDTGNFSFNSNDPRLYVDIAELLEKGVNKDRVYKLACDTHTELQLRLNAYAIYEKMVLYPQHRAALISLSAEELERFHYGKGDTEGLVNVPLGIPEIVYSAFLREDEDNFVKLSLRSKGDFPVNKICSEHFGGGGHKNAAGGELHCSLAEALEKFEAIMPLYDCYLERM